MLIFLLYIFLISIFTFILMFIDKKRSIKNNYRIPESTFINLSLLGGAVGTYIGMYLFRHKTLHKKFYIGIPLIIFFNIFCIVNIIKLFFI